MSSSRATSHIRRSHFYLLSNRPMTAATATMAASSPTPSGRGVRPSCRQTGSSPSTSAPRTSKSPGRSTGVVVVPRALRLARVLFYSWAASNFVYAIYVQLIVLKGPGRTPLPASIRFGRDTLFLTFHANVHCTWYACLCLLHAVLTIPARRRLRSRAARCVEWAVHRFTPLLFPLASFVGLAYYLILHFHPLNRLRAQVVPDHDAKMALLHLNPLLFVLGDSWLKDADLFMRHAFKQRRAVRVIIGYGVAYFLWTVFCTRLNGRHWPYPFQHRFSVIQHVMFLLCALLSVKYLTTAGFRLHGRLDRRRRRRLAGGGTTTNSTAGTAGSGATAVAK